MASDDHGFDLYVKVLGRPTLRAALAPVPTPVPTPTPVAPPAAPATPAKKIEIVAATTDSPTGVDDVPPPAPTENKLGNFDMSAFSNSLQEAEADAEIPTAVAESEEDQVLESLIEEFEKRNGREPTEEEVRPSEEQRLERSESKTL